MTIFSLKSKPATTLLNIKPKQRGIHNIKKATLKSNVVQSKTSKGYSLTSHIFTSNKPIEVAPAPELKSGTVTQKDTQQIVTKIIDVLDADGNALYNLDGTPKT